MEIFNNFLFEEYLSFIFLKLLANNNIVTLLSFEQFKSILTWNQTCVTLLERPVWAAILSKSDPSGLQSHWKWACSIDSCSSAKVVRTRLVFVLVWAKSDNKVA